MQDIAKNTGLISDLLGKVNLLEGRLKQKDSTIQQKNAEINFLKEQLKLIRHKQFGKQSETANSLQIEIPFEPQESADENNEEYPSSAEETITYTRKKKTLGRKIDTSNLPRETVVHDLSEAEKTCACCDIRMESIGSDTAEKLEYIPATLKVVEHVRPKYACRQCETIKSAKKPDEVIPKSMASASLLTEIVLAKYQNHIPLYRQSKIFAHNKLDLPANTLGNWVLQVGEALEPLGAAQQQQLPQVRALQADETPVKNIDENKKTYMWCYQSLDPGNRFVIFEYSISRGAQVPLNTLAEFSGILQTDGYSGYNGLRDKSSIIGVGCFAHVRRKFADVVKIAGSKKPGKAHEAVSRIEKLYRIEAQAREQQLTHAQRYQLRQEKAKPLLDNLKKWLEKSIQQVPPKSAIAGAVSYALNQWEYVAAYADHGEIEIDNNLTENQIRPFALGRRNWLFVGNERGAKAAAIMYSLIQSCIINDIIPREYFNDILPKLPAVRRGEIDAVSLLPQFFTAAQKG